MPVLTDRLHDDVIQGIGERGWLAGPAFGSCSVIAFPVPASRESSLDYRS